MASPAPFTQHPTLPSSLIKERPASRALISEGASAELSRRRSDPGPPLRFVVVHDDPGVEGEDLTCGVVMSGLISARDAPASRKAW